jgi:hypothetical protein
MRSARANLLHSPRVAVVTDRMVGGAGATDTLAAALTQTVRRVVAVFAHGRFVLRFAVHTQPPIYVNVATSDFDYSRHLEAA